MAKFCTKCGSKLVDGKCPNCENKTTEVTTGFDFNELVSAVKGMFTKPVDTIKEVVETENITIGGILIAINAVIIALFCCLSSKELIGVFASASGFNSLIATSIEIPYARIFFTTLVIVLVTYAILAGLFYLVADKLFHGNSSYKKMLTYLGITSVILTVTMLGTIIFMYVSVQLMMLILLCGIVLSNVYMIQGFRYTSDIDKNKIGYTYGIVYLIILIITMFILPAMF